MSALEFIMNIEGRSDLKPVSKMAPPESKQATIQSRPEVSIRPGKKP
jgi:hypothetical protein